MPQTSQAGALLRRQPAPPAEEITIAADAQQLADRCLEHFDAVPEEPLSQRRLGMIQVCLRASFLRPSQLEQALPGSCERSTLGCMCPDRTATQRTRQGQRVE